MSHPKSEGCGSGACGCGGAAAPIDPIEPTELPELIDQPATVNGVPLHGAGESPDIETLRQRAYAELLRQAAQRGGLLAVGDAPSLDGVLSEAASLAIERLLERDLVCPEPDAAACERYYAAHPARFSQGEQVRARHILFAVTPGVDVDALRRRAEALLITLRCADQEDFAAAAAETSNCPTLRQGGDLGWLHRQDCAPELAGVLFAQDDGAAHVGVLPRLVSSRFGFHILRIEERKPGQLQAFAAVQSAIAQTLRQQAYVTALRQYLNLLVGAAKVVGVPLDAADSMLVQ